MGALPIIPKSLGFHAVWVKKSLHGVPFSPPGCYSKIDPAELPDDFPIDSHGHMLMKLEAEKL